MTDRHAGYLVTLDEDLRSDDAEEILTALRMVKGVLAVEPIIARPSQEQIGYQRADHEWRLRIYGLLDGGAK